MRYNGIHTNILLISMLVFFLPASFMGCGAAVNEDIETETSNQEEPVNKEDASMEQSAELLMNKGGLEEDSAYGTVEQLQELGVPSLLTVEVVSKKRGLTLRVVDEDGTTYYLGYGGMGYLEIIRLGTTDGKILYAPEE